MHACIGVMRALNQNVERVFDPNRKEHGESASWRGIDETAFGRSFCWRFQN